MYPVIDITGTCLTLVGWTPLSDGLVFNFSPAFLVSRVLRGDIPMNTASEICALILLTIVLLILLMTLLNQLSYKLIKNRILRSRRWDLNICCGMTDGGGVNADIVRHADVPNYVQVNDIYDLPFKDGQFEQVLCSHTIEHVDNPEAFLAELRRVGRHVTLVIPPLWDISAAFNLLEHRHIFLTLRKVHTSLPPYVKLPFANKIQDWLGQVIHA